MIWKCTTITSCIVVIVLAILLGVSLGNIAQLKADIGQYRFEVMMLEQVRDNLIGIETTKGYPKLYVGGEYCYLLNVDLERIPLPFQQIELNGERFYLVSDKHQIMSDGTVWDWEKARTYNK